MCVLSEPLKISPEAWYDSLAMGEIMALGSSWQVAFILGAHNSSKVRKEGACTVKECKDKPRSAVGRNYSSLEL